MQKVDSARREGVEGGREGRRESGGAKYNPWASCGVDFSRIGVNKITEAGCGRNLSRYDVAIERHAIYHCFLNLSTRGSSIHTSDPRRAHASLSIASHPIQHPPAIAAHI